MRQQKQALLDHLQHDYTHLKAQWGGDTEYDDWFASPLNNAQLNSVATYYDLVPGFEQLLAQTGAELGKFYEAADKLAHEPKAERHRRLLSLGAASAAWTVPEDAASASAAGWNCASPEPQVVHLTALGVPK